MTAKVPDEAKLSSDQAQVFVIEHRDIIDTADAAYQAVTHHAPLPSLIGLAAALAAAEPALTAAARADAIEVKQMGDWIVSNTDTCTCGGADQFGHERHEPNCGWEALFMVDHAAARTDERERIATDIEDAADDEAAAVEEGVYIEPARREAFDYAMRIAARIARGETDT